MPQMESLSCNICNSYNILPLFSVISPLRLFKQVLWFIAVLQQEPIFLVTKPSYSKSLMDKTRTWNGQFWVFDQIKRYPIFPIHSTSLV